MAREPKKSKPTEPTAQSLGRRIKKARLAKGESVFGLALEAALTEALIEMLEKGTYQPTPIVLWRIARHLGVSVDALLKP